MLVDARDGFEYQTVLLVIFRYCLSRSDVHLCHLFVRQILPREGLLAEHRLDLRPESQAIFAFLHRLFSFLSKFFIFLGGPLLTPVKHECAARDLLIVWIDSERTRSCGMLLSFDLVQSIDAFLRRVN